MTFAISYYTIIKQSSDRLVAHLEWSCTFLYSTVFKDVPLIRADQISARNTKKPK